MLGKKGVLLSVHLQYISYQEKSSLSISTAEKKILIALCYYVMFALIMQIICKFNLQNGFT